MIYTNAMLDIETMSIHPDAAIADIGVVLFDVISGTIGPTWTATIDLDSAVRCGGRLDSATVMWWMQQEEEPRMRIAGGGGLPIKTALEDLAKWMGRLTIEPEVWSNGANFDGVILRQAYTRAGIECPWAWWNERCYRTVAKLYPGIPIERTGTKHVALDDAIDQAQHLIKILKSPAPNADLGALEWHDAATDKPDCDTTVLCWGSEGFFCGYWDDSIPGWIGCESGGSVSGVTHWSIPNGPHNN